MDNFFIESIRDEIALLKAILDGYESRYGDGPECRFDRNVIDSQIRSYRRIVERYENGIEYKFNNDQWAITKTQGTKHLERQFPEVAESAANHKELLAQAETMRKLRS